jgi:Rod binding domain-containing protein
MDALAVGHLIAPPQSARAASGTPVRQEDEKKWEALYQTGRIPKDAENNREFLRFLCRQLESVSVNILFQAARRTVPQEGLLSGGFAGQMYQGLADEEYSRLIAARGGFGLGDALFSQIDAQRAYAAQTLLGRSTRSAQRTAPQGLEDNNSPRNFPSGTSSSPRGVR